MNIRDAIQAELDRLGLVREDLPAGGFAGQGEALLKRLRGFSPGATWRDVLPDLPAHWLPGRPETWTTPYRPLGPYDYQELPTGPAVHVGWPKPGAPDQLERLVAEAKQAGWPIYGAGLLEIANPKWSTIDAMIVLERGTGEDVLGDFLQWLDGQVPVSIAAIPRTGKEQYMPSGGAA